MSMLVYLKAEHLTRSLKAEGKPFDYELFENIESGHSLECMATRTANEIRFKVHKL